MNKFNVRHSKIDEVVVNKYEHLHDISLPKLHQSNVTVLIGFDH